MTLCCMISYPLSLLGTAEVLEQVLDSESRCSDDENDSDDGSAFHPSDVSDDDDDDDEVDDDDDDNDVLWEAEAKNNAGSKTHYFITSCVLLISPLYGHQDFRDITCGLDGKFF